jgi:hypothetical protein
MKRVIAAAMISIVSGVTAEAQTPPPMPPDLLDMAAGMVIEKYKSSSCEDLKEKKGGPPAEIVDGAAALLRSNPPLRVKFINKIAAPIANKMFECGMIP